MFVEGEDITMNVSLTWGFLSRDSYNVQVIPHDSCEIKRHNSQRPGSTGTAALEEQQSES